MDLYALTDHARMTTFLIVAALWVILLLGGWLLVGRSLGRGASGQSHAAREPSGCRDQDRHRQQ